jgi:UDP-N-acetylglucosamine 2-epimerase (non-hydrolysing)
MEKSDVRTAGGDVCVVQPFGFFEIIRRERNARCALNDSRTVQEECAISGVHNVTLCDLTERRGMVEFGSNMPSGADPDSIVSSVRTEMAQAPA